MSPDLTGRIIQEHLKEIKARCEVGRRGLNVLPADGALNLAMNSKG
ncbi:MAG: hypothetical protein ACE5G7_01980 [Candidatus Hydrothermarchaeaceae archaeon]